MEIVYGRPLKKEQLHRTKQFLAKQSLDYDDGAEFTVNLLDGEQIAATGSREGNVLKCIAVAEQYRGEGLTAAIVTQLINEAVSHRIVHLFLFTKPEHVKLFCELGFYPIAVTNHAALLENIKDGINHFIKALKCPAAGEKIGGIVANCNPFTNGHLYLIERAAAQCDFVHLFILSEDKSHFPADVRLKLARQATAHLKNVLVHTTGSYLVSAATFPDYFIKDKVRAKQINCELDITIFAQHFAKQLKITHRFVGNEPFCPVTNSYNEQMKMILPKHNIQLVEILRTQTGGREISASAVRALLNNEKLEKIKPLVPTCTYEYLQGMVHQNVG